MQIVENRQIRRMVIAYDQKNQQDCMAAISRMQQEFQGTTYGFAVKQPQSPTDAALLTVTGF